MADGSRCHGKRSFHRRGHGNGTVCAVLVPTYFYVPPAVVLGMACYSDDRRGAIYGLVLALGGVMVAGYHTLLIAGFVSKAWIPCGSGVSCTEQKLEILNGLQIPWLSLTAFLAITLLLFVYIKRTSK